MKKIPSIQVYKIVQKENDTVKVPKKSIKDEKNATHFDNNCKITGDQLVKYLQ